METKQDEFTGVLDTLLQKRHTVVLASANDAKIQIRPLPFTTLIHTLMTVFSATRADAQDIRSAIMTGVTKITEKKKDENGDVAPSSVSIEEVVALFDLMLPLVYRLIASTPEAASRILKDVVIGITDEHVERMPADVALEIVGAALDTVDKVVMTKQIVHVFSNGAALWRGLSEFIPKNQNPSSSNTGN